MMRKFTNQLYSNSVTLCCINPGFPEFMRINFHGYKPDFPEFMRINLGGLYSIKFNVEGSGSERNFFRQYCDCVSWQKLTTLCSQRPCTGFWLDIIQWAEKKADQ